MKECIKCKQKKPLDGFYDQKSNLDGKAGKCKDCCKKQAKERDVLLRQNPDWVEREKIRHRDKYNRLAYKEKHKKPTSYMLEVQRKYRAKYPEKQKAKNASQRMEKQKGNELHHWSYNEQQWKDVIELTAKQHGKLHRYIIYDPERMMYRRSDNNVLLDTKEAHIEYMKDVLANKPD